MELETLFTDQKWNILSSLSREKYSPLQLANLHNTSIANISQQLRLLEAADLVKKEKIRNRDKGKPRTLFSLSHDYIYLISAMGNFAKKRLLKLKDFHKMILKIWFIDNPDSHYYVEKFFWSIEPHIDKIEAIVVNSNKDISFFIFTKEASYIRKKVSSKKISKGKEYRNIKVKIFSDNEIKKQSKNLISLENAFVIYDPKKLLSSLNKKVIR